MLLYPPNCGCYIVARTTSLPPSLCLRLRARCLAAPPPPPPPQQRRQQQRGRSMHVGPAHVRHAKTVAAALMKPSNEKHHVQCRRRQQDKRVAGSISQQGDSHLKVRKVHELRFVERKHRKSRGHHPRAQRCRRERAGGNHHRGVGHDLGVQEGLGARTGCGWQAAGAQCRHATQQELRFIEGQLRQDCGGDC